MAGSSRLLPGSSIGLHALLQLLAGAEGHDRARRNRDFLAGLRVAAGTLVLLAQLEVAEAGELDALAVLQRFAQRVEERVHEFLRFALVQADFLEQTLGHLGLGQRHRSYPPARTAPLLNKAATCNKNFNCESSRQP